MKTSKKILPLILTCIISNVLLGQTIDISTDIPNSVTGTDREIYIINNDARPSLSLTNDSGDDAALRLRTRRNNTETNDWVFLNDAANGLFTLRNYNIPDITPGNDQETQAGTAYFSLDLNGDGRFYEDLAIDGNLSFGNNTRQMLNLWGTQYGIGIQSSTQYYRTAKNFAWYKGGAHNGSELNAGGGTTLMSLNDNGDLDVNGEIIANGTITVDKAGGDLLKMAYGSGDYGGFGFNANGPYFRTPENSNSGAFFIVNGNNVNDRAVEVGFDGSYKYMKIGARLAVGSSTSTNTMSNTVAHFDGRVYISEDGGSEKGLSNTGDANYQDYLLWVEKGIVSKDFALAELSDWPDYVFENNYLLRTLNQVESFIEDNGHLPTMPSASEVENKGFTVGDMTKRMVQTIEELTLHTIEQEKQITKQSMLLEKLMARILALENQVNK